MSKITKQELQQAKKQAIVNLVSWMDMHVKYTCENALAKVEKKRQRKEKPPADQGAARPAAKVGPTAQKTTGPTAQKRTKLDVACAGNVLQGIACPTQAQATDGPSIRHNGKQHKVCDDCRKKARAFRRKQKKEKAEEK